MSLIELSVDALDTISNTIKSIDKDLIGLHLPNLVLDINEIKDNVIGDELIGLLNSINEKTSTISSGLTTGFSKLEDFLDKQRKGYRVTEEEAQQELRKVLGKMRNISNADHIILGGFGADGSPIGADGSPIGAGGWIAGGSGSSIGAGGSSISALVDELIGGEPGSSFWTKW